MGTGICMCIGECVGIRVGMSIDASIGCVRFFFQFLGACRRRTPRICVDLRVRKDASHRVLSDATLRSDLAPRRSPSECAEKLLRIDPKSRHVHRRKHWMPAWTFVPTCADVCMHMYMHICVHTCVHTCADTRADTRIDACIG